MTGDKLYSEIRVRLFSTLVRVRVVVRVAVKVMVSIGIWFKFPLDRF